MPANSGYDRGARARGEDLRAILRGLPIFLSALCLPYSAEAQSPHVGTTDERSPPVSCNDYVFETLHLRSADYPHDLLVEKTEGTACLSAVVDENSKVVMAQIVGSSGDPGLDKASLDYVKHIAHIEAPRLNGKPVKSVLALALTWSLTSAAGDETVGQNPGPVDQEDPKFVKRGAVLFEHDSTSPNPSQFDGINLLASDLKVQLEQGVAAVQLRGYGGAPGNTTEDAHQIALKRAMAIRDLLIADGVPPNRIELLAIGGIDDGGEPDRVDLYVRRN